MTEDGCMAELWTPPGTELPAKPKPASAPEPKAPTTAEVVAPAVVHGIDVLMHIGLVIGLIGLVLWLLGVS